MTLEHMRMRLSKLEVDNRRLWQLVKFQHRILTRLRDGVGMSPDTRSALSEALQTSSDALEQHFGARP